LADILGHPEHNGLYRLPEGKVLSDAVPVKGRLTTKTAMLKAVSKALKFPDYFGHNWDAMEECLTDMSWHAGAVVLLIEKAAIPEAEAPKDWTVLLAILADSARYWQAEGRSFAVFLQGGHTTYPMVAA
jgi:hypothetical protein